MTLLQVCTFTSSFFNNCQPHLYIAHFSRDIDTSPPHGWEYLLVGTELTDLDGSTKTQDVLVQDVARNKTTFTFWADSSHSEAGGFVELPVLHYKGYVATCNGTKLTLSTGSNNVVRVEIPSGLSGLVTVRFVQPLYWRIADVISLLSFVLTIVFFARRRYGT